MLINVCKTCVNVPFKKSVLKTSFRSLLMPSSSNPEPVKLSRELIQSKEVDTSLIPIAILHGILGNKNNWKTVARILSEKTKRKVFTLDARNHGTSPHKSDTSYLAMCSDMNLFMEEEKLDSCIYIGHSMGGRTSMVQALTNPSAVEKMVIVDIAPVTYNTMFNLGIFRAMRQALEDTDKTLPIGEARKRINLLLSEEIESETLRQFLLTNLTQNNNIIQWRVNLEVFEEYYHSDIMQFPEFETFYDRPSLFICGTVNTEYSGPQYHPDILRLFPMAKIVYVRGAGHNVHIDKSEDFVKLVLNFLEKP